MLHQQTLMRQSEINGSPQKRQCFVLIKSLIIIIFKEEINKRRRHPAIVNVSLLIAWLEVLVATS